MAVVGPAPVNVGAWVLPLPGLLPDTSPAAGRAGGADVADDTDPFINVYRVAFSVQPLNVFIVPLAVLTDGNLARLTDNPATSVSRAGAAASCRRPFFIYRLDHFGHARFADGLASSLRCESGRRDGRADSYQQHEPDEVSAHKSSRFLLFDAPPGETR